MKMKRIIGALALLVCVSFAAGVSARAETGDPLLNKLVEKGLLSQEEADRIQEDVKNEVEKKPLSVDQATGVDQKDIENVVKALKGFKFNLLWYLSYQNGETGDAGNGTGYNQFVIKRGYFRVTKDFTPWFTSHMTLDVTTAKDTEPTGDPANNLDGSIVARIKYAYGQFNLPDVAFLTKPKIEFGIVHIPWLDFEENLNWYRAQDTMFIERNGLFNSADIGATFFALLGGEMPKDYQNAVNNKYPGRYGSTAFGLYNGGGYAASEANQNKVFEGRVTLRPLPELIPGLQFSYFGAIGKGNAVTGPNWTTNIGFVSYEHEDVVLTGQYYRGRGRQSGSDNTIKNGYSFFSELKLYNLLHQPWNRFSLIGRFDHFDPNIDMSMDTNDRYIAGVAYYLDQPHKNMFILDYDRVNYAQSNKSDDKRVQLTLQVAY